MTEVERLKQRIRQSPDELTRNVKSAEDKLQRAKVELEEKEKVLAAQIKKRNEMLVIEEVRHYILSRARHTVILTCVLFYRSYKRQ